MTCSDIARRLETAGIDTARDEARLLAARLTGMDENTLRLSFYTLSLPDPDGKLETAVAAREKRTPLQYILGLWPFWRQEYEVTPACLIPRADTEILVEEAVKTVPPGARILDLCTGSGCIAVSLLAERPDLTGEAVDLFPATLELAKRNALRNGVLPDRLRFSLCDVLASDAPSCLEPADVILSNPPYIPQADLAGLAPELAFEPRAALDGGADGLVFYRRFLSPDWMKRLKPGGFFLFEIGYDQGEALRTLGALANCDVRILRDLGGLDRVAVVKPK